MHFYDWLNVGANQIQNGSKSQWVPKNTKRDEYPIKFTDIVLKCDIILAEFFKTHTPCYILCKIMIWNFSINC